MGSASAVGIGRTWLLRSRSPTEAAAFWTVLILSYLALYGLAETRGIGYSERLDPATNSASFDLNPFLWFPGVLVRLEPAGNPGPFILWWLLLGVLTAEVVMIGFRFIRTRARPKGRDATATGKSKPA